MAWSDPKINKLLTSFVAAAGEVSALERGRGAGSELFRKVATPHVPGLRTTQGIYVVTPAGKLLASGHSMDPRGIERLLSNGLKKWKILKPKARLGAKPKEASTAKKSKYPADGLILSVVLRKFSPKERGRRSRRRGQVAWNQDFAWFKKAEAAKFLPKKLEKGVQHNVPESLVQRLTRLHLTDTVRAFADPYPKRCVEIADLTTTILAIDGDLVSLRLKGAVSNAQYGMSRYARRQRLARNPDRSYDCTLLGYATFDLERKCFVKFELIARGTQRGGGARSSGGAVPMDVAFTLTDRSPLNRVEPRHIVEYTWD